MKAQLTELWRYRSLLFALAQRDIRIKYKQSVMGFMWAVLMPVLIVAVGVLVRYAYSLASGQDVSTADVAGVAIRAVPWAFTVSSIRFASNSLVSNHSLVTKIYFPKEIFPLAAVGSSLFDMSIASIPLIALLIVAGATLSVHLAWVPLLLFTLVTIVTGIAFIMSAAGLFFRDVKYLVEVGLTFGIFITPVFFETTMFGEYGVYMHLNPLAAVLEGLSAVVIRGEPPNLFWLSYSLAFGVIATTMGYLFFKRLEPAFAESI